MKKRTKLVALLMAMVLVMGSMTACGGSNNDPKETSGTATNDANGGNSGATGDNPVSMNLKVWVPQEDTQDYSKVDSKYGKNFTQYLCDEFNKAHPEWDIKFEISPVAEGDTAKQVQQDPNNAADVFMVAGDNMVSLVDAGLLSSITLDGVEDVKANNSEKAIKEGTFHNDAADADLLYGIPFSPNTWFMYYDKSKLSEDDVKSLETILAKDTGCTYNFSMPLENSWYNSVFFFTAGCTLFGADGTDPKSCDFNSEAGQAAGKYMIQLAKNKKFFSEVDENVGLGYLKDGKLAAWCGGSWNASEVRKALGKNYGATVLPTINIGGKDQSLKPLTAYKYVAVSKKSGADAEQQKAAQALALWLGGEQAQRERLLAREVAPTWTSVLESKEAKDSEAVVAVSKQVEELGYKQPGIPQMANFWDPVKAFGQWANSKKASDDKVKAELDKLVDNILAEIATKKDEKK